MLRKNETRRWRVKIKDEYAHIQLKDVRVWARGEDISVAQVVKEFDKNISKDENKKVDFIDNVENEKRSSYGGIKFDDGN